MSHCNKQQQNTYNQNHRLKLLKKVCQINNIQVESNNKPC